MGELRRLDLERVARTEQLGHVDRAEAVGVPQLEAAAEVAEGQAERQPRCAAADAAERQARRAPPGGPAAGQVARREHEPGVALEQRGAHLRELLGRVREVAVHLADDVVAALQTPGEAGAVGQPEAVLAGAMQHVHPRARRRELVGQRAGAVG